MPSAPMTGGAEFHHTAESGTVHPYRRGCCHAHRTGGGAVDGAPSLARAPSGAGHTGSRRLLANVVLRREEGDARPLPQTLLARRSHAGTAHQADEAALAARCRPLLAACRCWAGGRRLNERQPSAISHSRPAGGSHQPSAISHQLPPVLPQRAGSSRAQRGILRLPVVGSLSGG